MNDASCAKKSKDRKTNADCCIKEDPPKWCPDTSLDVIRANVSKMKSSLRARKITRKLLAKAEKELFEGESESSLKNDPVVTQYRNSPNNGLGNFWWPFFCRWNKRCCTHCYLKFYSNIMKSDYKGYLFCIWRKCQFIPENLFPASD